MNQDNLIADYGIDIVYFDGRENDKKGFFNHQMNVIAVDAYMDKTDKKKVKYHEFGHKNHTASYYKFNREKAEQQADRCMIHHLLQEYLPTLDEITDFNVYRFMDLYRLKTITNETMIIEEYKKFLL